jgi:hypothetical protein
MTGSIHQTVFVVRQQLTRNSQRWYVINAVKHTLPLFWLPLGHEDKMSTTRTPHIVLCKLD